MQKQLENRTVAKEKVSQYMLQYNVQHDAQMIHLIQAFSEECMKRIKESSYLVGPEGAFQVMAFGLAGIAMIDITLEIVVDGLTRAARGEAATETESQGGTNPPESIIETPGVAKRDEDWIYDEPDFQESDPNERT